MFVPTNKKHLDMENFTRLINVNHQEGTLEVSYSGQVQYFRNEEMNDLINSALAGWVNKVVLKLINLESIELSVLNGLIVVNKILKFYGKELEIIVSPNPKTEKLMHQTKFDQVLPLRYSL